MKQGFFILVILFAGLHVNATTTVTNYKFDYSAILNGKTTTIVDQSMDGSSLFTFSLEKVPCSVTSVTNATNGALSPIATSGLPAVLPAGATYTLQGPAQIPNLGPDQTITINFQNGNAIAFHFYNGGSENFVIGALIKSIAGVKAPDELLDVFMKVNLTKSENMYKKPIVFSLIGADAGISTTDTNKNNVHLNEAVANVNFCLNKLSAKTERVGFVGGGLKVFNGNAYTGAHIGLMETKGTFEDSYFMIGYYYSPWLNGVKQNDTVSYNFYRHNIFFEAAINAFGDNVPTALQSLRLKFGLLLPIGVGTKQSDGSYTGDAINPTPKDFIFRLAVEIPIGGPLKF